MVVAEVARPIKAPVDQAALVAVVMVPAGLVVAKIVQGKLPVLLTPAVVVAVVDIAILPLVIGMEPLVDLV